jgi:uncharacterized protein
VTRQKFDRTLSGLLEAIEVILAEVNSTFGESQNYWLSARNAIPADNSLRYAVPKRLHVSPFMKMDLDYRFVFTSPGDSLLAHMNTVDNGTSFFDATLQLKRKPWSARTLHRTLLRYPWMTLKVISAIHWQALKLYLKKVPVFPKPEHKPARNPTQHEGDSTHASVAHL